MPDDRETRAREVLAAAMQGDSWTDLRESILNRTARLWSDSDSWIAETAVASILTFADEAVKAERERCAQIAEATYAKSAFHFELGTAIATAIRGTND